MFRELETLRVSYLRMGYSPSDAKELALYEYTADKRLSQDPAASNPHHNQDLEERKHTRCMAEICAKALMELPERNRNTLLDEFVRRECPELKKIPSRFDTRMELIDFLSANLVMSESLGQLMLFLSEREII